MGGEVGAGGASTLVWRQGKVISLDRKLGTVEHTTTAPMVAMKSTSHGNKQGSLCLWG